MDTKIVIKRIDKLLDEYAALRKQCQYDDFSGDDDGVSEAQKKDFSIRCVTTIKSIAPKDSTYIKEVYPTDGKYIAQPQYLIGILTALKSDIENGYLWNLNELIHADVFADFLEMARYLLGEGYKDPSAVLTAGVLEEHLRKLCIKNAILIEENKDGKKVFKKASLMNDELKKSNVYGNLEHKSIIAWIELRNNASHGKYDQYNKEQVEIMLAGVRDLVIRFPA